MACWMDGDEVKYLHVESFISVPLSLIYLQGKKQRYKS